MRLCIRRVAVAVGTATVVLTLMTGAGSGISAGQTDATPATDACAGGAEAGLMGTPGAGMGMGMGMASPEAAMETAAMPFDQMYIDMMIPHHVAIIAMAQAAEPRLQDERLAEIARTIVATQGPEIEELRGYREQFSGDPEPMPMDGAMMAAMAEAMPRTAGDVDAMAFQMDPAAQVAAICGAADTNLAFIEMTIAHHEMAIAASEDALERAEQAEIRAFAQRVIDDQRREIEALVEIRQEMAGSATPAAAGA